MSFISFMQDENSNTTVVDNDFIRNYMPHLSGDFLKIYLYMLMLSSNKEDVSIDEVAGKFGIFSSEVVKALSAMSKDGICEFSQSGDNYALSFNVTDKSPNTKKATSRFDRSISFKDKHDSKEKMEQNIGFDQLSLQNANSGMMMQGQMPQISVAGNMQMSSQHPFMQNIDQGLMPQIPNVMPSTMNDLSNSRYMYDNMIPDANTISNINANNNQRIKPSLMDGKSILSSNRVNKEMDNNVQNITHNAKLTTTMSDLTENIFDFDISNITGNQNAKTINESNVDSDNSNTTATTYSADELSFMLDANPDISELKLNIEKTYATTFNSRTIQTLVDICQQEFIPTTSLNIVIEYIHQNNKKLTKLSSILSALESKAIELSERGLKSPDEIREYLISTSQNYIAILKRFGIVGRIVTHPEKMMINKWINSYNMPIELILEACDKTIMKTGRASFDYADAILKGWAENKITSLDALNKYMQKAPKVFNKPQANYAKQTTKFNNYTENQPNSLSDFELQNMTKLYDRYGKQ